MIKKLSDDITIVTLGNKTVYTSVVYTDNEPIGISFSNSEKGLKDAVVIQMDTQGGIASFLSIFTRYMEAMSKHLGTDVKDQEEYASMRAFMDKLLEEDYEKRNSEEKA